MEKNLSVTTDALWIWVVSDDLSLLERISQKIGTKFCKVLMILEMRGRFSWAKSEGLALLYDSLGFYTLAVLLGWNS